MAAETLAIEDAEVEQLQQTEPATHSKIRQPRAANAMRGIASFHRRDTVFYQVSVCVQSFYMTARKVKDLDRAVDILLILMSIKQKVGRVLTAKHPYPLLSSEPVPGAALFFFFNQHCKELLSPISLPRKWQIPFRPCWKSME